MWKFKASKYRNTAPKIPKKEQWIGNLKIGGLRPSCGNHIKASAAYMVFNIEAGGGSNLAVLPVETHGRQNPTELTQIQAHTEFVTDFDFAPWDDYLLATGSSDSTVRIWDLPKDELSEHLLDARWTITESKRIENILWNPLADGILAASLLKTVKVFDVSAQQEKFCLPDEHDDHIQSISWKGDGSLLISSCKDKKIRIIDPRDNSIAQEAPGHQNIKDSRAVWLGNSDQVLTTGFGEMRQREVCVRDVKNLREPLKTVDIDTSTGSLMPLYDPDTGMLFLAGKGDTTIRFLEVTEKDPYVIENAADTVEQIRGLAMAPKRIMDVMKGEVARLFVLAQHTIVPIPYCVPRKSYAEYHGDLFPDTYSGEASMTAEQWLAGENTKGKVISLDPSKKGEPSFSKGEKSASSSAAPAGTASPKLVPKTAPAGTASPKPVPKIKPVEHTEEPESQSKGDSNNDSGPSFGVQLRKTDTEDGDSQNGEEAKNGNASFGVQLRRTERKQRPTVEQLKAPVMPVRRTNVFSVVGRPTKLRLMKGNTSHKSNHIENLKKLSQNVAGESDGFHCNRTFAALNLSGPGGMIAVLKLSQTGRLPDTALPAVQNGCTVTDFAWDPMDDCRLVASCDDARIRVWTIPEEGPAGALIEPTQTLQGHMERIYFVKFHPLAKDVLASASFDMTLKIWDLETGEARITLDCHPDPIMCMNWSADGQKCATVCRDGKIRVFNPRESTEPLMEGPGPEGTRGARLIWACNDKYLVLTCFDKMSERKVTLYDASNVAKGPMNSLDIDSSPSILIPHYDEDTSTLFFTGRGDSTVNAYEVAEDQPHFFMLDPFKTGGVHHGLSFLPKCECNVKKVEFAKAYRLTKSTIEPVSFTMPRRKLDYFQDDIFPDTKVLWEPTMTSSEWFSGTDRCAKRMSLQPSEMKKLSEAPVEAPKARKYQSFHEIEQQKTDKEKKDELLSAMTKKMGVSKTPLPQDLTEGAEEDEWSD